MRQPWRSGANRDRTQVNKAPTLLLLIMMVFSFGCGRDQDQNNEKPSPQETLRALTSDKDEGVRVLAELLLREIRGDTEGALKLITDNALVKYADSFGGMDVLVLYLKGDSILLSPNYRKQLAEGKLVAIRRIDSFWQMDSTTAELEVFWRKQDGITAAQVYAIDFVEGGQLAYVGWVDGQARVLLPPIRSLR